MIAINKEESRLIRERFPRVTIVRTMRQKSARHRYYMEESPKAMRLIERLRGAEKKENAVYTQAHR